MEHEITIKHLGQQDLALLLAVPEELFDNPIDPEHARAFLDDPLHELVLAFDGDLAVAMASGTILYHPDKQPAMFINEVGTRDTHLRRGIARRVSVALIEIARRRGCKGIWLATETDNAPALGLYRAMKGEEQPGVFFGWDDAL